MTSLEFKKHLWDAAVKLRGALFAAEYKYPVLGLVFLKYVSDNDSYFTYFSTCHLIDTLKQRTHGSVFDTITRDTLASVRVVYPPIELINTFESEFSPIMEHIKANLKQTNALIALRDNLLPLLISGEIKIKKAEKFVTAAL